MDEGTIAKLERGQGRPFDSTIKRAEAFLSEQVNRLGAVIT